MRKEYKAALFDLDGTLIDHFTVIYRCYAFAMKNMGLPPTDYDKVRATVGGSVPVTMARLVGEAHAPEAVKHYYEHYRQIWMEDLLVLEGAAEIIRALKEKGLKTAVFTNKGGDSAREIARHIGLADSLDAVLGTNDTPHRKPDKEFTRHILHRLGVSADEACLVGDSTWDIKAAKAVQMDAYTVATGTHPLEDLRKEDHGGAYPSMRHLAKDVFGLELAV